MRPVSRWSRLLSPLRLSVLASIYHAVAGAYREARAQVRDQALAQARAHLEVIGIEQPFELGETAGTYATGVAWRLTISPVEALAYKGQAFRIGLESLDHSGHPLVAARDLGTEAAPAGGKGKVRQSGDEAEAGFTLLEMLIGLALLAVIASLLVEAIASTRLALQATDRQASHGAVPAKAVLRRLIAEADRDRTHPEELDPDRAFIGGRDRVSFVELCCPGSVRWPVALRSSGSTPTTFPRPRARL